MGFPHLFSFVFLVLFLALSLTFFYMFLCTIPVAPLARNVVLFLSHTQARSLSLFLRRLCLFRVCSRTCFHSVSCLLVLARSLSCSLSRSCFLFLSLVPSGMCSHPLTFCVRSSSYAHSPSHAVALSFSFLPPCVVSLSFQTFCILYFLGKIRPFCYPASGQGIVIQDSLMTRDNTAL